jgi:hypothetical protein
VNTPGWRDDDGAYERSLPDAEDLFRTGPEVSPAEAADEVRRSLGMRVPDAVHRTDRPDVGELRRALGL